MASTVTIPLLRAAAAAPERATQSRTRTPRQAPLELHTWRVGDTVWLGGMATNLQGLV
jgi:hypothetical protein